MVFYFTGTGNSLYAAKQLDAHPQSIPQLLHQKELRFQDECIGIVCPIYGHELPPMVKEFLARATFQTSYFYLVLTYGMIHGGCVELAQQFLASVGKKADYINTLLMVDNYLPAFDMQEQMKTAQEKDIDRQITTIASDIQAKEVFYGPVTEADRSIHQLYLDSIADRPSGYEKDFYRVTKDCIGCGICTRVCPAGCIRLEMGRAVHTGENCQMCMACVHHCPQGAILLNVPEKNPNARFHNEHIRLTEIVAANDQTRRSAKHEI